MSMTPKPEPPWLVQPFREEASAVICYVDCNKGSNVGCQRAIRIHSSTLNRWLREGIFPIRPIMMTSGAC